MRSSVLVPTEPVAPSTRDALARGRRRTRRMLAAAGLGRLICAHRRHELSSFKTRAATRARANAR